MLNPNVLHFPLRSNANWFQSSDAMAELDRRLKLYSMLYERLAFEDGRVITTGGSAGIFELCPPLDGIDRTRIDFMQPDSEHRFLVGFSEDNMVPLFGGQTEFGVEIDFFPVLTNTGLGTNADWIDWYRTKDLTPEQKRWVNDAVNDDRSEPGLQTFLPGGHFVKGKLLEGFYGDSILMSQRTFCVSSLLGKIAAWRSTQDKLRLAPDLRDNMLGNAIAEIGLPDFSTMHWDEIAELRSKAAAQDLREVIARLSAEVRQALTAGASQEEVNVLISNALLREIAAELCAKKKGIGETVFGLLLNLLPFAAQLVGAIGQPLIEGIEERASWTSFLQKPQR